MNNTYNYAFFSDLLSGYGRLKNEERGHRSEEADNMESVAGSIYGTQHRTIINADKESR